MEVTKAHYDLGLPYQSGKLELIKTLREAYKCGYRTVAIEQIFDHSKKESMTTKRTGDIFPEPNDLSFLDLEFKGKLKIIQRLTIIYSDIAVSHAMTNSLNIKKYQLIAGLPKSDAALTHCCSIFNGDIVSFDPDFKLLVSRKAYKMAVGRGMCFEIKYAPAIVDSSKRKEMIRITHNYHAKGKSKNIIFTSGANNEFELRSPYDIANLALIFGMTEEQSKSAMHSTCRTLLLKAQSRRLGKTIMFVKQLGPTVLSSSSDDSDSDDDSMRNSDNDEKEKITENVKDDCDNQQPFKKKKLN